MTRPDHGPYGDDLDVITRTSYGRLCGDLKQPLLQPMWVMKKPLRWRPGNDVQIIPILAVIWLSRERHRRTSSWRLSVTFRNRPYHGWYGDDWDVISTTSYGQFFSNLRLMASLGEYKVACITSSTNIWFVQQSSPHQSASIVEQHIAKALGLVTCKSHDNSLLEQPHAHNNTYYK